MKMNAVCSFAADPDNAELTYLLLLIYLTDSTNEQRVNTNTKNLEL